MQAADSNCQHNLWNCTASRLVCYSNSNSPNSSLGDSYYSAVCADSCESVIQAADSSC